MDCINLQLYPEEPIKQLILSNFTHVIVFNLSKSANITDNPSANLASLEVPLRALQLPLQFHLGVEQHLLGLLEVAQPGTGWRRFEFRAIL